MADIVVRKIVFDGNRKTTARALYWEIITTKWQGEVIETDIEYIDIPTKTRYDASECIAFIAFDDRTLHRRIVQLLNQVVEFREVILTFELCLHTPRPYSYNANVAFITARDFPTVFARPPAITTGEETATTGGELTTNGEEPTTTGEEITTIGEETTTIVEETATNFGEENVATLGDTNIQAGSDEPLTNEESRPDETSTQRPLEQVDQLQRKKIPWDRVRQDLKVYDEEHKDDLGLAKRVDGGDDNDGDKTNTIDRATQTEPVEVRVVRAAIRQTVRFAESVNSTYTDAEVFERLHGLRNEIEDLQFLNREKSNTISCLLIENQTLVEQLQHMNSGEASLVDELKETLAKLAKAQKLIDIYEKKLVEIGKRNDKVTAKLAAQAKAERSLRD